ncbi:hypothetical protein ACVWXM_002621 [Bradyrhizobium sp. GM7.3]
MRRVSAGWTPDTESHEEQEAHWAAVTEMWRGSAKKIEKLLGPIVDRVLLTKASAAWTANRALS